MKPVTVVAQTFEAEVLESPVPVVVDFWAPWCGPCRLIAPVLERLAEEYDGRVKVAKVNVDEEQELAVKFRIRGIPALFVLDQGEVVDSVVGFGGAASLEALFERLAAVDERPPLH